MCGISGIYSKDDNLELVLNNLIKLLKIGDQIIPLSLLIKRITLGWAILDCQY